MAADQTCQKTERKTEREPERQVERTVERTAERTAEQTAERTVAQKAPQKAKARHLPDIDPGRCTGCGRCLPACAPHVLVLERRGWEKVSALVDAAGCTGCHHCAWRCPFDAITMRPALDPGSTCSPGAAL